MLTLNGFKWVLRRLYESRRAYLFLLPIFALLLLFSYIPAFNGIFYSFFDWSNAQTPRFVGLANFRELFGDTVFLGSIGVMLKIMLPKIAINIVVPFVMAELIFAVANARAKYWYRVLVLLPMVAPGVVYTLLWKYIYDANNGLMTMLMRLFGVIGPAGAVDWLRDPHFVIFSVIFLGFPWVGGTAVLIYMSGLMNISTEIIESSVLDGCGAFRRIWFIDLPMSIGQIRYFLIFGIIGGLQDYSVQIVLTKGGPGYSTMVPGYYMFTQAFDAGRMGYASAVGACLFAGIFLLTLLSFRFVKVRD